MSKPKKSTSTSTVQTEKVAPREKASTYTKVASPHTHLLYGVGFYKWLALSFGVMILGFILMMGGAMPDPNSWDPSLIYNPIHIILAPFIILLSLGMVIYGIFKK